MMTNQKVTIVPAESGALVRAYAGAPEFGYLHLQTVTESVINGWVQESKRSYLLKGNVELLTRFIEKKGSSGQLPGNIVVVECLEDAIPEHFKGRLNKELTDEEAIAPFLKRAGKDGPVLTKDGVRILRFTDYDPSGQAVDTLVQHDPFSAEDSE
jgi:hypothetical protein